MAQVHLPSISPTKEAVLSPNKAKAAPPDNQFYEGHKFYWKQRLNVDLNFLHHKETQTYEIVAYDTDKDMELPSMFLSEEKLIRLTEQEVDEHVVKMKQEIARDRFKKAPPDEEIISKSRKAVISQFILNRLVAFVEESVTGLRLNALSGKIYLSNNISSDLLMSYVVDNAADFSDLVVVPEEVTVDSQSAPAPDVEGAGVASVASISASALDAPKASTKNVKQTQISRRRRTTSAEFDKKLLDLRQNSKELDQMCNQASRLTELSRKSVDAFKDALLANMGVGAKTYDKTSPIGMFKWLANRIILQNTVQKVREDLMNRDVKEGLHINATFPNPNSTLGTNPSHASAQMQRVPHLAALTEGTSREGSPFTSPRDENKMGVSSKRADRMAASSSNNKSLSKSHSTGSTLPPVNGKK
jgi:hypothetical protein